MSIGAEVAAHLPFLRRYARALTGSQSTGDAFVRATLEAALADERSRRVAARRARAALPRVQQGVVERLPRSRRRARRRRACTRAAAQDQLRKITPLNRQALLLTTVEDFSPAEAGEIMDIAEDDVNQLVQEAVEEIERETATSVLIIEDEPLISMQLEDLVRSLGHEICGTAATRTQAQQVVAENRPGLVLADIQLADGSSGLDAVDDILAIDRCR